MKVNELLKSTIHLVEQMMDCERRLRDESYEDKIYGVLWLAKTLLDECEDYYDLELDRRTRRDNKEFSYKQTFVATDWDVSLNKLYGNDLVEGQEYSVKVVPIAIVHFDRFTIPVFDDDPGQCWYVKYRGIEFSTSSWSICPAQEIYYELINYIPVLLELERLHKESCEQ